MKLRVGKDAATTEDLRTAMIHYRSLFEELVQVSTIKERVEVHTFRRVLGEVCAAKSSSRCTRTNCAMPAPRMLGQGTALMVIQQLSGFAKLTETAQYSFVSMALMQKTYNGRLNGAVELGIAFFQLTADEPGCSIQRFTCAVQSRVKH
jgi:hypothetical protein